MRTIHLSNLCVALMGLCAAMTGCASGELTDDAWAPSFSAEEAVFTKADHVDHEGEGDHEAAPLTCSPSPRGHDPNGVHALGDSPHFEGWYYRAFDPDSEESWVLIAAYWINEALEGHAFVELVHHPTGKIYKQTFRDVNITQIQNERGRFALKLGELGLFGDRIRGQIFTDMDELVTLDLAVDGCARWGAPNDENNRWTMGWATEIPGVPLRWHVNHLKAFMSGSIRTPETEWTLDSVPLHQEKNWGRAFPTTWIWLQSNHFQDRPDVAFVAAGGPVFPSRFSPNGYMAGLRWKDQFFTWRTQDMHRFPEVAFWVDEDSMLARWRLVGESANYRFEVDAEAPLDGLIPIDVPTDHGLMKGAVEHLAATMEITVYRRVGVRWQWLDTVTSSAAAVEAGGDHARSAGLIP